MRSPKAAIVRFVQRVWFLRRPLANATTSFARRRHGCDRRPPPPTLRGPHPRPRSPSAESSSACPEAGRATAPGDLGQRVSGRPPDDRIAGQARVQAHGRLPALSKPQARRLGATSVGDCCTTVVQASAGRTDRAAPGSERRQRSRGPRRLIAPRWTPSFQSGSRIGALRTSASWPQPLAD
jgi:hypothetical protein